MKIEVFSDETAVAHQAADFIAAQARAEVAAKGRFLMALSGGRTPWVMLRALATLEVPWKNIHVVQVDERVAPAGHADRNLTHIQETLLDHVPLPPDQFHARCRWKQQTSKPPPRGTLPKRSSRSPDPRPSWTSPTSAWGRTVTPRPWFREIRFWKLPTPMSRLPAFTSRDVV